MSAHRSAYELAPAGTLPDEKDNVSILHRDISVGNIIIHQGHGVLIDWELAKVKGEDDVRAAYRTVSMFVSSHCHVLIEND